MIMSKQYKNSPQLELTWSYFPNRSPVMSLPLKSHFVAFKSLYLWKAWLRFASSCKAFTSAKFTRRPTPERNLSLYFSIIQLQHTEDWPHLGYWPLYRHICNCNYL